MLCDDKTGIQLLKLTFSTDRRPWARSSTTCTTIPRCIGAECAMNSLPLLRII